MKLRLFSVRDSRTKNPSNGEYFSSKPEAKARRDQLNAEQDTNTHLKTWVVTYGPDHRHFKG